MKKTLVLGAAALFVAGAASADSITFDVDLEGWGAVSGNIFSIDFGLPAVATIDSVEIELAHSWASDIDFSLTAPNGDLFDLTSDNGGSGDLGDGGSTLGGVANYTFVEAAGNGLWTGDPIPGGTYDSESWHSTGWGAGSWNLNLEDDAGGDDGAVGAVTVNYTVPAPGALALLGLAGFAARRRRRA